VVHVEQELEIAVVFAAVAVVFFQVQSAAAGPIVYAEVRETLSFMSPYK